MPRSPRRHGSHSGDERNDIGFICKSAVGEIFKKCCRKFDLACSITPIQMAIISRDFDIDRRNAVNHRTNDIASLQLVGDK